MVTTYLNYSTVTRNLKQSLIRVSQQADVSREAAYFRDNIGKVKNVDDLMNDYRLYQYATKAYGLEDMAYAKAFMRKVLESDLSSTSSFANRLNDKRYQEFAAAFAFNTPSTNDAQSGTQTDEMIGLYTAAVNRNVDAIDDKTGYYNQMIGKVRNVDALLSDDRLRDYVFSAYGIDNDRWSYDTLKNVLSSDPDDPASYVNTVWVSQKTSINAGIAKAEADATDANIKIIDYTAQLKQPGADANDLRAKIELERRRLLTNAGLGISYKNALETIDQYVDLARAFQFSPDGTLPTGVAAQTDAARTATNDKFVGSQGATYLAADEENVALMSRLYRSSIANVKTVDAFVSTPNVYNFALKSVGLDPNEVSPATIKAVLKSDPNDPKSFVHTLRDERYVQLAQAFNFDSKGNFTTPVVAQDASEVVQVARDYIVAKTRFASESERPSLREGAEKDVLYYQKTIVNIDTVTELLADRKLVNVILASKGLQPDKVSSEDLRKIFASNLNDPKSFANSQSDPRFAEIAASFNFGSDGHVVRVAKFGPQTREQFTATQQRYLQQTLETQQGETNPGVRLALYFQRKAPSITSAYDILADKALSEVFRTIFNLPDSMGAMDVDKQAKVVEKYMKLKDLADPAKLTKLLSRFAAMYDIKNSGTSSSALSILQGGNTSIGESTFSAIARLDRRY